MRQVTNEPRRDAMKPVAEMTIDELRAEASASVVVIGNFLRRDATSYIFMKASWRTERMPELGGGNFAIGLYSVTVLELYAALYSHLTNKKGFWKADDVEEIERLKKVLVAAGENEASVRSLFPSVREGRMRNAAAAVRQLLNAVKDEKQVVSGFPISKGDIFEDVWKGLRNNMAHKMVPALGITIGSMDQKQARKDLKLRRKRFKQPIFFPEQWKPVSFNSQSEDREAYWQLDADVMASGFMMTVSVFLKEKIGRCQDIEKLRAAVDFLRGEKLPEKARKDIP